MGIVFVTSGRIEYVPFCVWLSAFFDFLDGFFARMLNVKSEIGKEFDSLADMITFGLLPAFVVFQLLSNISSGYLPFFAFLLAIFSGLRLAKFNVDTTQRDVFIGMPTPAVALLITGLIFLLELDLAQYFTSEFSLLAIAVIFSWLMVSPFRFIALKFDHYRWNGNELKFVLLIVSVILLTIWGLYATPFVIMWYILISLLGNLTSKI